MELLDGEDLAERVKRVGPLSLLEVATIVSHVSKALSKAHQAGIVHRDIKMNNVFLIDVDGELYAKLLDFGIAKQQGKGNADMTTTGAMVGTLAYMSPEQLHNAKEVDFRSDLWSLAVVAYRALTGQLPFREEDGIGALLTAVNSGSFTLPSEISPEIPPALDEWFQKALRRDPAERFASAREMAEELDLAAGRESTMVPSSRMSGLPALPPGSDRANRDDALADRFVHVGRDSAFAGPSEAKDALPPEAGTSAGIVHAQTIAEPKPVRRRKPRSLLRVALAGLALGVAGAGSVAAVNRGWLRAYWPPGEVASEPVAPADGAPSGRVDAPSVAPAVAPSAASALEGAASAEAKGSSSGTSPLEPASSSAPASSAAAPSASASAAGAPPPPSSKAGGTKKPGGRIRKEKDYGF
jgi:serine/threonine-protein kinase